MLINSFLNNPISDLKDFFLNDLSIFDLSLVYILGYVIYKTLGRYIYFKPQEHATKINRTFLSVSLFVIFLSFSQNIYLALPFKTEYRGVFVLSVVTILTALLSIIMYRIFWKHHKHDSVSQRYYYYNPIQKDYHKTSVYRSETHGSNIHQWEEEGITTTDRNLHSDSLLNVLALAVFLFFSFKWAIDSSDVYNHYSILFCSFISLWVSSIYINESIISWISFIERGKLKEYYKKLNTYYRNMKISKTNRGAIAILLFIGLFFFGLTYLQGLMP